MKSVFLLIFAALAVEALPAKEAEPSLRYVDAEGHTRTVDFGAPVDTESLSQKSTMSLEYWLYTRNNPNTAQNLVQYSIPSLEASNFDPTKETVFIVHGWLSNGNTQPNTILRNSYLAKSDVNIITVDWRRLAYMDINTASAGVPTLGAQVGAFINWLTTRGLDYGNVHLIGFCLGAHMVGMAGRVTGGSVARITALSPPRGWESNPNRLLPSDGVYVEAIHTNGGSSGMGMNTAIAGIDFFPNGGVNQPGCYGDWLCNYNRAWQLFDASVSHNHLFGYRCNGPTIGMLSCQGENLRLGNDDLRKTGTPGIYYVLTYRNYPY